MPVTRPVSILTKEIFLHMNNENQENTKKKKRVKEGRRIKTLPAISYLIPYLMPQRNDALNYVADSIDISNIEKYVARKRAEGYEGFGIMHVFMAAYVRTVAENPAINRYIRGQRIYARNGVQIIMTVKKEMNVQSPDTVIKISPDLGSTAVDVYRLLSKEIADGKQAADTSFDKLTKVINMIPGLFLRWTIKFLGFLDYFRLLPKGLVKLSPFHGSIVVTSMGSLGIPPIYHHIYNFGNIPLFMSFGAKRYENVVKADGTVAIRKMIDYKLTTDERVCDGFTYAVALKNLRFYLKNPDKLDTPPAEIIEDIK